MSDSRYAAQPPLPQVVGSLPSRDGSARRPRPPPQAPGSLDAIARGLVGGIGSVGPAFHTVPPLVVPSVHSSRRPMSSSSAASARPSSGTSSARVSTTTAHTLHGQNRNAGVAHDPTIGPSSSSVVALRAGGAPPQPPAVGATVASQGQNGVGVASNGASGGNAGFPTGFVQLTPAPQLPLGRSFGAIGLPSAPRRGSQGGSDGQGTASATMLYLRDAVTRLQLAADLALVDFTTAAASDSTVKLRGEFLDNIDVRLDPATGHSTAELLLEALQGLAGVMPTLRMGGEAEAEVDALGADTAGAAGAAAVSGRPSLLATGGGAPTTTGSEGQPLRGAFVAAAAPKPLDAVMTPLTPSSGLQLRIGIASPTSTPSSRKAAGISTRSGAGRLGHVTQLGDNVVSATPYERNLRSPRPGSSVAGFGSVMLPDALASADAGSNNNNNNNSGHSHHGFDGSSAITGPREVWAQLLEAQAAVQSVLSYARDSNVAPILESERLRPGVLAATLRGVRGLCKTAVVSLHNASDAYDGLQRELHNVRRGLVEVTRGRAVSPFVAKLLASAEAEVAELRSQIGGSGSNAAPGLGAGLLSGGEPISAGPPAAMTQQQQQQHQNQQQQVQLQDMMEFIVTVALDRPRSIQVDCTLPDLETIRSLFRSLVTGTVGRCGGRIVRESEGSAAFMASFTSGSEALAWERAVQRFAMFLPWPAAALRCSYMATLETTELEMVLSSGTSVVSALNNARGARSGAGSGVGGGSNATLARGGGGGGNTGSGRSGFGGGSEESGASSFSVPLTSLSARETEMVRAAAAVDHVFHAYLRLLNSSAQTTVGTVPTRGVLSADKEESTNSPFDSERGSVAEQSASWNADVGNPEDEASRTAAAIAALVPFAVDDSRSAASVFPSDSPAAKRVVARGPRLRTSVHYGSAVGEMRKGRFAVNGFVTVASCLCGVAQGGQTVLSAAACSAVGPRMLEALGARARQARLSQRSNHPEVRSLIALSEAHVHFVEWDCIPAGRQDDPAMASAADGVPAQYDPNWWMRHVPSFAARAIDSGFASPSGGGGPAVTSRGCQVDETELGTSAAAATRRQSMRRMRSGRFMSAVMAAKAAAAAAAAASNANGGSSIAAAGGGGGGGSSPEDNRSSPTLAASPLAGSASASTGPQQTPATARRGRVTVAVPHVTPRRSSRAGAAPAGGAAGASPAAAGGSFALGSSMVGSFVAGPGSGPPALGSTASFANAASPAPAASLSSQLSTFPPLLAQPLPPQVDKASTGSQASYTPQFVGISRWSHDSARLMFRFAAGLASPDDVLRALHEALGLTESRSTGAAAGDGDGDASEAGKLVTGFGGSGSGSSDGDDDFNDGPPLEWATLEAHYERSVEERAGIAGALGDDDATVKAALVGHFLAVHDALRELGLFRRRRVSGGNGQAAAAAAAVSTPAPPMPRAASGTRVGGGVVVLGGGGGGGIGALASPAQAAGFPGDFLPTGPASSFPSQAFAPHMQPNHLLVHSPSTGALGAGGGLAVSTAPNDGHRRASLVRVLLEEQPSTGNAASLLYGRNPSSFPADGYEGGDPGRPLPPAAVKGPTPPHPPPAAAGAGVLNSRGGVLVGESAAAAEVVAAAAFSPRR